MPKIRDNRLATSDTVNVATSVGILYRVSSAGQDEENQVPELETYCYDSNYRINRRYSLHDKSASKGEHETELEKILDDVRKQIIQVVVMVHSSRIDRRDIDTAEFYHQLIKQAGGRLESVREPMFGKSDISGRVVTMLAQHANHEYSKSLSGHIRAAHDRIRVNRGNGAGLLGRAPFGYEIAGNRYEKVLVPTPLGIKYITIMYDRIIKGDSLTDVAIWLNTEGVTTPTLKHRDGQPTKGWTASAVWRIVKNSVYKGQMRDSKHNVVGTCEAIVSAAVWKKANDRLASPPKRGPRNNVTKKLLTSHSVCVLCGLPMYPIKTAAKEPYYRCRGNNQLGFKPCGVMIRVSILDKLVSDALASDDSPVMKLTLIPGKNYDDEIDFVKAQIKTLASDVDADDYEERHEALMSELKRLKTLDTTPDEWREEPTGETFGGNWNAADFNGKRAILEDVKIYVGKNERNEPFAIIDINSPTGLVRRHIAGEPTGPSLLARAQGK